MENYSRRFSSTRIDILLLTKPTHELNWDASIRQWSRQSKQIPSQETFWGTSRPYLCYQKYKITYHQSITRSIVYIKKHQSNIFYFGLLPLLILILFCFKSKFFKAVTHFDQGVKDWNKGSKVNEEGYTHRKEKPQPFGQSLCKFIFR